MQSGNNSNEASCGLVFERVDSVDTLSDFSCGLPVIDDFIHNELHEYVCMGECELWIVKDIAKDEVVAMFCLGKSNLSLSESAKKKIFDGEKPAPQQQPDSEDVYWWSPFHEATEITYLAVAERRRKQHIGSFIIEEIMNRVASLSSEYAGDYVIVRALQCADGYTAVPFYEKCGFFLAEDRVSNKNLFMYRVVRR